MDPERPYTLHPPRPQLRPRVASAPLYSMPVPPNHSPSKMANHSPSKMAGHSPNKPTGRSSSNVASRSQLSLTHHRTHSAPKTLPSISERPPPSPRASTSTQAWVADQAARMKAPTFAYEGDRPSQRVCSNPSSWRHSAIEHARSLDQPDNPKRGTWRHSSFEHVRISRSVLDDLLDEYDEDLERWMKQDLDKQRQAKERERERSRLVQEEITRIQDRVRQRRENERQRFAEERKQDAELAKAKALAKKAEADRAIANAWLEYEARWATFMVAKNEPLSFSTIPWPLLVPPTCTNDISPDDIGAFVLSSSHSQEQARKDRLRSALLRWHPDRFRHALPRIPIHDREDVMEGVGIVVRCLNDLLAREPVVTSVATLRVSAHPRLSLMKSRALYTDGCNKQAVREQPRVASTRV